MPGGVYSALSGMQSRLEALERVAADLANTGTAGYKTERGARFAAERDFASQLQSAVDVSRGGTRTDLTPGTIAHTGNDLDVAIDGQGFFAIQTGGVVRYTRSGNFTRRTDGVLATVKGEPVLDAQYKPIKLGPGRMSVDADGTINADGAPAGRISVWQIEEGDLLRDTGMLFRPVAGVKPRPSDAPLVPQSLEQANVSMADRMTSIVDISRSFEALQKGISVLMNDIDSRAISELGRR